MICVKDVSSNFKKKTLVRASGAARRKSGPRGRTELSRSVWTALEPVDSSLDNEKVQHGPSVAETDQVFRF